MKSRTLAQRILAAACALSMLILCSWILWVAKDMRDSLLKQKEKALQQLLARNRDYMRLYAEGLASGLLSLSDALAAIGNDPSAILNALYGSKNSNPGKLLTVYCTFEDGHTLCTHAPAYEVFGNQYVKECYDMAYQSSYRGIRWTEPYISPLWPLSRTIALYKPVELAGNHAMVMMEINLSTMLSSILRVTKDASITWSVVSAGGKLVATSDDYTTIVSEHKQLSRSSLETALPDVISLPVSASQCSIDGNNYIFYRESNVCMNWTLYTFVKGSHLYAEVRPLVTKTLLTGTTHLLLLSLLIAMFSGYLTRPITRIAKRIEEAESPLELTFDDQVQQPNEIRVLTNSLTSMIEKIRQMTQEFEESQKQQRMLEIEVLQAQIHPHFIGNTLACIQSLIKEEKLQEAEGALVALVKLFNYSIARTDEQVSLGDELRCAEAYVKLRQMRKNYSFDYQVFVPQEQLTHRVPRLFLQPIIENCIVHGFAGLEHRGVITVTGYEKNGKLFLCVDDNGLGVTEARLCDVVNGTMPPSPHSHGIGVSNVFKRLRLRRAEADGCSIQSRAGGGVRVILDLGCFRP